MFYERHCISESLFLTSALNILILRFIIFQVAQPYMGAFYSAEVTNFPMLPSLSRYLHVNRRHSNALYSLTVLAEVALHLLMTALVLSRLVTLGDTLVLKLRYSKISIEESVSSVFQLI
jgi:hypothetical protein